MDPLECAMGLASASSKCERFKCPYITQCKGDYTTCKMKEVALIIRSQNAEIESLKSLTKAYNDVLAATQAYIQDIEKVNKRYHDIIVAFEHGYRPKNAVKRKRVPKRLKDPKDMDGKKRYEQSENNREPVYPIEVI